jgi:hypothetical protein
MANPAAYSAMFDRATQLRFGHDSATPLRAAFGELRAAAFPRPDGEGDPDTLTEVLWAGLHGLVTLGRTGRLVPGLETERIDLLVSRFSPGAEPARSRPAADH